MGGVIHQATVKPIRLILNEGRYCAHVRYEKGRKISMSLT